MEYADGESAVPPTVTLLIAARHVASSTNVTLNGKSTVAPNAAVSVGEVAAVVTEITTFDAVGAGASFVFSASCCLKIMLCKIKVYKIHEY